MTKNLAELLLDHCIQNDITYIEKGELRKIMDIDDESFKSILDYLVERHLADVYYNDKDGKEYIMMNY